MTNLSDFLKVKTVRCVSIGGYSFITVGKEYDVVGVDRDSVFIVNDDESEGFYSYKHFEPVLDSSESPLQKMELTPEFEASEPKFKFKFKVGDKVYWGLKSRIFKVYRLMTANVLQVELDDCVVDVHKDELCPATLENYGKLCSLFECIDFEQPNKPLTGSDLARAMVDKGWFIVDCYVSAISDEYALRFRTKRMQVALFGDGLFTDGVKQFPFAVPFDPKTGEPLTESILND